MDIDNLLPEEDMHVRVNGQTNRLTSMKHDYANHNEQFHFVVSKSEGKTTVTIQLGKGHYILNNIQAWTGSFDTLRDEKLYESRLVYDDGQPDGDSLSGTIKVEQDAWLITSIPYDSHFTIEVDGQETELQEVNTAFLGARLSAGRHKVVITYHAAGKTAGILLSVAGLLLSAGLLYYERRNRQLQNT